MTESSGGHTPLSRMRFSWQRQEEAEAADTAEMADTADVAEPSSTEPEYPSAYDEPLRDFGAPTETEAPATPVEPPPWSPDATPYPTEAPVPSGYPPPVAQPDSGPSAPPPPAAGLPAPEAHVAPPGAVRKDRARRAELPDGKFDVPAPGGRFGGRRGLHAGVRATLVITCCLVVLGTVGFGAYVYGVAAATDTTYNLSDADVRAYHLADFPVDQAGQFAADYVRICLSQPETEAARTQRESDLAQFSSAGVDPTCGWNGGGVQTVTDVQWTGESSPVEVDGYREHARWFTIRALTSSGRHMLEVPVYVEDRATGTGLRIVGDLGEMPQPVLADVELPERTAETDVELAESLVDGEFFAQYFAAWGESDGAALGRLVSTDALPAARAGLNGTLVDPRIDEATVFYPADADTEEFSWQVGDTTEAWVRTIWRNPQVAKATVTRSYRVQLIKIADAASPAQEWAVRDIRGGVPDVDD